jgi:hypothetical protein
MKGFELNDEELQDMFTELHSDLQKFIGEFHGKIDNFFKDSQFDKDEFDVFVENPSTISRNYNYDL